MNGDQVFVVLLAVALSVLSVVVIFIVMRRFVNPGMLLLGLPLPQEIQNRVDAATAILQARLESNAKDYEARIVVLEQKNADLERSVDWLLEKLKTSTGTPSSIPAVIPAVVAPVDPVNYRQMLVAVGDEPGLQIDLAIFRRNQIFFERLNPVSKTGFEAMINRGKRAQRPFLYIHLAVHTSAAGCQFVDGLATPEWLSERLGGVKVLLIAGCVSTEIGDWLGGIAEYVVTMAEPVSLSTSPANSDIGLFSESFWAAIYNGKNPQTAFYDAIVQWPNIGEIANIHTGIRR
jgi:hypothetical protein